MTRERAKQLAEELVGRMTAEEKAGQLRFDAIWLSGTRSTTAMSGPKSFSRRTWQNWRQRYEDSSP